MDSDAQRSLHDDPDALQTMLLLLRRADLHRVRSINSGWRDGVKAVLLSEEWQRSFADLVTVRSPTQELALRGTVLLHPDDAPEVLLHLHLFGRVVTATCSEAVAPGELALNALHRSFLNVECGERARPRCAVSTAAAPALSRCVVEVMPRECRCNSLGRGTRSQTLSPGPPCNRFACK